MSKAKNKRLAKGYGASDKTIKKGRPSPSRPTLKPAPSKAKQGAKASAPLRKKLAPKTTNTPSVRRVRPDSIPPAEEQASRNKKGLETSSTSSSVSSTQQETSATDPWGKQLPDAPNEELQASGPSDATDGSYAGHNQFDDDETGIGADLNDDDTDDDELDIEDEDEDEDEDDDIEDEEDEE